MLRTVVSHFCSGVVQICERGIFNGMNVCTTMNVVAEVTE
jgi:hypothetical protein